MAATVPDCSIDYSRWYSLPCAVPPSGLAAADLANYFSGLDLVADRYFCKVAGGITFDPLFWDPAAGPPDVVRFRTIAAGGTTLVLPRSSHVGTAADAPPIKVSDFETAVAPWSTPANLSPGDTGDVLAQKTMAVFPWTKEARAGGDWPMPLVIDDSMPLWWPAPGPDPTATPPNGAATVGVLQSDGTVATGGTPTHLLTSNANSWTGEYAPTLLRAPAFGLVRFQRYRHVVQSGVAAFTLNHPSAAGRLVITVPPRTPGIPDASVAHPTDATTFVVIDHVTVTSAVKYFGALLAYQVTHFADFTGGNLVGRADSKKAVRELFSEMIRSFVGAAQRLNPPQDVSGAAFQLFVPPVAGPPPLRTIAQIKTAIDFVNQDAGRQTAFIAFVRTMYVPVICGMAVMDPALAPAARSAAGALLCYAGCPLGEPANAYAPAGANVAAPNDALANAFTTFDVEAMHILGLAQAVFGIAAINHPAPAETFKDVPLDDFAPAIVGMLAVGRCAEPRSPTSGYGRLTPVTLTEVINAGSLGVTRTRFVAATLDLSSYAQGATTAEQHPLIGATQWVWAQAGQARRAVMDQAHAAKIGAKSVAQATLDWWGTRTGLFKPPPPPPPPPPDGTWPALEPGVGSVRKAPTPRFPYLVATSDAQTTNGFDAFDLEAANLAQQAVRDGKTLGQVPLALFLALLRTEGFAGFTQEQRTGPFSDLAFDDALAGSPAERQFVRDAARAVWLVFPFGMDEFNKDVKLPAPATDAAKIAAFDHEFDAVLHDLTTPVASTIAGVPNASILDTSVLPTTLLRDYLENVFETKWSGAHPGAHVQRRILSRRTQWIGMALQMALFQWKHRCMNQAIADPHAQVTAFLPVTELQAADVPPIGPNANSAERCTFVAYWATVDLGWNSGPDSARPGRPPNNDGWNTWVMAAQNEIATRGTADTVPRMITLFRNPAGLFDAVLPALGALGDNRLIGQRGNMLRFAAALDLYARLDDSNIANPPPDLADPAQRDAAGNSNWKLIGEP